MVDFVVYFKSIKSIKNRFKNTDAIAEMILKNTMLGERKLPIKEHIFYDSIYKKCPQRQVYGDRK